MLTPGRCPGHQNTGVIPSSIHSNVLSHFLRTPAIQSLPAGTRLPAGSMQMQGQCIRRDNAYTGSMQMKPRAGNTVLRDMARQPHSQLQLAQLPSSDACTTKAERIRQLFPIVGASKDQHHPECMVCNSAVREQTSPKDVPGPSWQGCCRYGVCI